MSQASELNLASIKRIMTQRGLTFEGAYAYVIRKAVRKEGHRPGDFVVSLQKPQYHERDDAIAAMVAENPGIGRRGIIEKSGLTENQVADALQRTMKAGRIYSIRGNGSAPGRYYPGARQQVAAE